MLINKIFIESFVKATERAAYGASTFKGKDNKDYSWKEYDNDK